VQNNPTIVPVVAVALIDDRGRVLLQQRPAHKDHGGLWEFPGGKVEPAETLDSALIREIAEELAVALDPAGIEPFSFASRPDQPHVVMLYICRSWQGEPQAVEAAAIGWFAVDDLSALAMPPLDVTLAGALQGHLKR
jgi:8-oxo-dGTP diphosphatase